MPTRSSACGFLWVWFVAVVVCGCIVVVCWFLFFVLGLVLLYFEGGGWRFGCSWLGVGFGCFFCLGCCVVFGGVCCAVFWFVLLIVVGVGWLWCGLLFFVAVLVV